MTLNTAFAPLLARGGQVLRIGDARLRRRHVPGAASTGVAPRARRSAITLLFADAPQHVVAVSQLTITVAPRR